MHVDRMQNRMLVTEQQMNRRIFFSLLLKLQFGNLQPEIEINEYSSSKKLLK